MRYNVNWIKEYQVGVETGLPGLNLEAGHIMVPVIQLLNINLG